MSYSPSPYSPSPSRSSQGSSYYRRSPRNTKLKPLPRFMQPTESVLASNSYKNEEQDMVKNAFGPNTWTTIGALPKKIAPEFRGRPDAEEMKIRAQYIREQEKTKAGYNAGAGYRKPTGPYALPKSNRGTFGKFDYSFSEYDRPRKAEAERRQKSHAAMKKISDKPFGYASPKSHPGTGAGQLAFGKLEYISEPYAARSELASLTAKKNSKGKAAKGKGFNAGGSTKAGYVMQQGQQREGIQELGNLFQADFCYAFHSIVLEPGGGFIILFAPDSEKEASTITRYMNQIIKTNATIEKFGMRKDATQWAVIDEGRLLFTIIPPWVRQRKEKAYYKLHPDEAKFCKRGKGKGKGKGKKETAERKAARAKLSAVKRTAAIVATSHHASGPQGGNSRGGGGEKHGSLTSKKQSDPSKHHDLPVNDEDPLFQEI